MSMKQWETIKFPGNLVPRAFQGPSHFLSEKSWGGGWFPGSLFSQLFSSCPERERLARDAPGDEKKETLKHHAGSPGTVGLWAALMRGSIPSCDLKSLFRLLCFLCSFLKLQKKLQAPMKRSTDEEREKKEAPQVS